MKSRGEDMADDKKLSKAELKDAVRCIVLG